MLASANMPYHEVGMLGSSLPRAWAFLKHSVIDIAGDNG